MFPIISWRYAKHSSDKQKDKTSNREVIEAVKGEMNGPQKMIITFPQQAITIPQIGIPKQLEIPKIKVNASILQMGIDKDGNMKTPKRVEELGWYKYGPNPGDIGSAVIAGHLGVGAFERGVFKNLNKLRKGDSIIVTDDKGVKVSFVVRKIRIYDKDDRPTEVFNSDDGKSHLNLITCTGTWIKSEKTLSKRLVVFTDRLE